MASNKQNTSNHALARPAPSLSVLFQHIDHSDENTNLAQELCNGVVC